MQVHLKPCCHCPCLQLSLRWWLGGTNDEPRWLIVIVGVDQQEQTNDTPTWLIIFIVGVDGQEWTDNKSRWLVVVVIGVDG